MIYFYKSTTSLVRLKFRTGTVDRPPTRIMSGDLETQSERGRDFILIVVDLNDTPN